MRQRQADEISSGVFLIGLGLCFYFGFWPTIMFVIGASSIIQGLLARGSTLLEAQRQAYGALEGTVVKQTFLLTYMDAFRIVGFFFLCCIPLLLLFKRRRGAAPLPAAMH